VALTKRTSTERERVSPIRRILFSSRREELGLEGDRQVADLVEEERAGRSSSTSPDLSLKAPVNEPGRAEELALEERSGMAAQLTATNGPFRRRPSRGGSGRQLLARAALAGDEDRGVRVADLLGGGPDALYRRRLAMTAAGPGFSREGLGPAPPGTPFPGEEREAGPVSASEFKSPRRRAVPAVTGQVDEAPGRPRRVHG